MKRSFSTTFLVLVLGFFTRNHAQPAWTHHTLGPIPGDYYAFTWTGAEFVAVGATGALITSTNGTEWHHSRLP